MSRSPKSRRPKKTRTRKSRPVSRRGRSRVHKTLVQVGAVSLLALVAWVLWEGLVVYLQFEGRHWDQPARVYASPLELYAGRRLSQRSVCVAPSF